MSKNRLGELSFMNAVLCILTVFIHIISYPVSAMEKTGIIYSIIIVLWRMCVIVVPGFIMLASCKLFMKISRDNTLSYKRYYSARLKRVILPYGFWFVVYYLLFMFAFDYSADLKFISKHFFLGTLVYHLYFIPLLVQFDILVPLWRKIVAGSNAVLILPIALLFTVVCESGMPNLINMICPDASFIYNDRLFTSYLVFWLIGAFIGSEYERFKDIVCKNVKAISIAFGLTAIINIVFSIIAYTGKAYVSNMNMIHMAYVLCALLFLFMISILKGNGFYQKFTLVSLVDKLSYRIYLSHVLVLMGVDYLVLLTKISPLPATLLRIVIVYPVTILICMIIEKLTKIRFKGPHTKKA